jgi:hypothetical protein
MSTEETIYTYRLTHRVRTGGSGCLACVFFIAGLLCLIPFWPLSLIFLAIGWSIDTKTKRISTCGHCGNEVAPTCLLCPVCHADLAPEPRRWF